MNKDCEECGEGIGEEELHQTLLGLDVVGLFPAIKSKNTGQIVRRMVVRSNIKIKGFNWKYGARYIAMNKHLTGDLKPLWKLLPWTKSGKNITMKNKEINSKKEKMETKWCFSQTIPTEEQVREIAARVAEIVMRSIFENFTYKFGEQTFRQSSGGPIGARVTMAAARLVMQDWGENYRSSLERSKMEIGLLSGYVDDVRQGGTSLRLGLRFDVDGGNWKWSEEAMQEDKEKREGGEGRDERMKRLCMPVMNSINEDLEFTAETSAEFPNNRLPTLDFELWVEVDGKLNHNYYQKPMKTQYVTMKRSAMSQHQKIAILSNEIIRRLSKINHKSIEQSEITAVVEQFSQEMKVSGYDRVETREVVVSGLIGWKRKMKRREDEGAIYRSAQSTLVQRCRKKLMEKTTWYKKRKRGEQEDEDKEKEIGVKPKRFKNMKEEKRNPKKQQEKAKAVLFTPYTNHSELAKKLREAEEKLEELTGYRLKIVERAGFKLEDLLHKSDPWQGQDCGRELCLLCETKQKTGKQKSQDCTKRSCVYEIWCMKCMADEEKRIEDEAGEDKELCLKKKEKIKVYKYIGETSRSVYERALEHQLSYQSLSTNSYMLKHWIDKHEGEDLKENRFGIKVIKYTRSSFERQVLESVILQENKKHHLLNSKSEYNRCAIPRLTSKIGEHEYKKWEEDDREEKRKEEMIEEKVRMLRKERNKSRRRDNLEEGENMPKKRRKTNFEIEGDGKEKENATTEERIKQRDIRDMMGEKTPQTCLSKDINLAPGACQLYGDIREESAVQKEKN